MLWFHEEVDVKARDKNRRVYADPTFKILAQ